MTRVFIVPVFFILLSAYCLLPAFSAHAQSASELRTQIEAHNSQITALQAEIAKYQKELNVLGTTKNTLQSTINTLALQQKQLDAQINVTLKKISSANLKISELSLSIGDKEESIAGNQAAIAEMLRETAQSESVPIVARMLGAGTLTEAWAAVDHAVLVNRALQANIRTLENIRVELTDNRDAVSKTKAELVALQSTLATERRSVDLNKAAQQKLLTDTKNQESAYQKLLADKRAEEAAFAAALFELESKLQFIVDPSRIPPAGKGILRWPLAEVFVTQQFGQTSASKRLYTSGTHNGIDFRASIGTPVHASLSGTVLEVNLGAVPNCQYGKWVLLQHGNGLATLYAHLSDVSVKKGAVVTAGQVIGYSGNTGYATGPHLHFGVYLAEAISLKQYTCKSGYVVTIPIAPVTAYLDPLSYL